MTAYLLDTHAAIWFVTGDERVSKGVRDLIEQGSTSLFISVVSAWEYMHKLAFKPDGLPLQSPFSEIVRRLAASTLDLEYRQHSHAYSLPQFHSDPFDRMLIAQALDQGLTLVTRDARVRQYPVPTFW